MRAVISQIVASGPCQAVRSAGHEATIITISEIDRLTSAQVPVVQIESGTATRALATEPLSPNLLTNGGQDFVGRAQASGGAAFHEALLFE